MHPYLNIAYPPVVHTFGYGNQSDYEFLIDISKVCNGLYYAIYTEDQISEKIGFSLGGILTTVASDLTVNMQPSDGCKINSVKHGSKDADTSSEGSWTLKYRDLYAEEERKITVDMEIPPSDSDQLVMTIELTYYNAGIQKYHF